MKKYLLPENGQFYKANLHCHTNISDGKMTPQEVKETYMAQGYSIVAYTDHDVFIPHPELRDEYFLPLNGFEAEVNQPGEAAMPHRKCCHICFVAKEPDNVTMPFYHSSRYIWGNALAYREQLNYDPNHAEYVREFSHAGVNDMMRLGREAGFFVTYNHPTWSLEQYPDYIGYDQMDAMEIMNYGCWVAGWMEYNPRVYDDMLREGRRVYAIATDDNHGTRDVCGGWTSIKAEKLEYRDITSALEKGHFYASWGPEIHELWYEDGMLHIRCSDARRIICTYGRRRARQVTSVDSIPVTEAVFDVKPEDGYVRISVEDAQGRYADTNAYFTDTLLAE